MPHLHYVMDLYYPKEGAADGHSREVLRIEASDDEAAMAEAKRVDQWRSPAFYHLRAVRSAVRSGDKLIYSSNTGPAPEESVIALAPNLPGDGPESSSSVPVRRALA